ncbi:MAG: S8 family serine peptidase [Planctomycetota bacterium]
MPKKTSSRDRKTRKRRSSFVSRSQWADPFVSLEPRHLLAGVNIDFSVLAPTDYTHTEILVRFSDTVDVAADRLHYQNGDNHLATIPTEVGEGFRADPQLWEVPVAQGQTVEQMVNFYNSLSFVDYAEPNYTVILPEAVPNDPLYGPYQWGPVNIGAESAWDVRTDASSVPVAVIDSGVNYDQPDIIDNIWTNSGEIPGNGIDDDGNGYADDVYGWDFDNDDNDPIDDNGHGSHVAGTIGAVGNNGQGMAGVAWDATIMSLKVIGNGSNADVARAIDYATDNGAKITNNSYGYAGQNVPGSQVISDAIGRAKNSGVLYIVAAGNSRSGIPASDMDGNFNAWPAEYSKVHDNVITVAAINEDGTFANYSHWGDESVQIAAPGTNIASMWSDNNYYYSSGTSMATPHVAGAAALLWAERPDMSYLEIKDAILDNTRPDHLSLVGNGVLDLGLAMAAITQPGNSAPTASNDTAVVNEDNSVNVSVLNNDSDPDGDTLTIQSFSQGSNGSVSESGGVVTYTPVANFNGNDSFTYTINDGNGNTDSATVFVTINAVNDNPVAVADSGVTDEDVAVSINVLANDSDIDGDSLSVASVTQGADGTVVDNGDGTVTYTPDAGFFGNDSFTYVVSDGSATDSATVNVTVNEVVGGNIDVGFSGIAVDVTHVWTTINLPFSFSNPIVVAGGSTRDGGHQGVVRVQSVTANSFQIRFQEWDYRDGNHTTENIAYMVIEAGTHTLTDGTQIVAGSTTLTNENFASVNFASSFSSAPLVIGQVITTNDGSAVAERMRNITASGFQVQMQEEEAADGIHASETFNYVAIDQGAGSSGDTDFNAVVSGNVVTQGNTTVNFGSIGGSSNPVILSDMQTRDGADTSTLRHRSATSTSVTVWVEEEGSNDSELNHTTEVAGVLAMEAGTLVAANPLLAAGPAIAQNVGDIDLSDIESLRDEAVEFWRHRGFDTSPLASVEFAVSDLRNNVLGVQYGNAIVIDSNAAGHGWYVDSDISTLESFEGMDLYTTMLHELGHVLGQNDIYDASRSSDVMYGYLSAGERRGEPAAFDLRDAWFAEDEEADSVFNWLT